MKTLALMRSLADFYPHIRRYSQEDLRVAEASVDALLGDMDALLDNPAVEFADSTALSIGLRRVYLTMPRSLFERIRVRPLHDPERLAFIIFDTVNADGYGSSLDIRRRFEVPEFEVIHQPVQVAHKLMLLG